VYKHQNAKTLYVLIPSNVVSDSTFPLKEGCTVRVTIEGKSVVIRDTEA
jgi:hypothetical protein